MTFGKVKNAERFQNKLQSELCGEASENPYLMRGTRTNVAESPDCRIDGHVAEVETLELTQRVPSLVRRDKKSIDGWHYTDIHPPEGPPLHKSTMVAAVVLPFLGFVLAVATAWSHGWIDWFQLGMMATLTLLTGFGITVGYHRLLTHQAFETYGIIRAFWMIMGALAVQKSPLEWCSVHRRHHALSDRPGDPHSPHHKGEDFKGFLKGFWHAHVGWLFTGYLHFTDHKHYVPDLCADRMALWVHKYYEVFWIPLSFVLPTIIGFCVDGWPGAGLGVLWGGLVRIFLIHHITWCVNSVCHIWGTQEYKVKDQSKNNLIFSLLCFGEGWHNNHHAFPSSARQGLKWWQFDSSWVVIRTMRLVGLAWNVKLPTETQLANKTPPDHRLESETARNAPRR